MPPLSKANQGCAGDFVPRHSSVIESHQMFSRLIAHLRAKQSSPNRETADDPGRIDGPSSGNNDPAPIQESSSSSGRRGRSQGLRGRQASSGIRAGVSRKAQHPNAASRTSGPPAKRSSSSRINPSSERSGTPIAQGPAHEEPKDSLFGNIPISGAIARALSKIGYLQPTPIQEMVAAPMLDGLDVVGQAQTGTGKTAAFGIPLAMMVNHSNRDVQALILVPTRELARQVAAELSRINEYTGISVCPVYGGAPIVRQMDQLRAGCHIVVGTPGRVVDLIQRDSLRLGRVGTVVLDEADQMLDIGFLPDIRRILRSTPRQRQTALFSATIPTMIRRLIYSSLKDPQWLKTGAESEPVQSVRQLYCEVARRDKLDAILEILVDTDSEEQTIIFRRTQEDVEWLERALRRKGLAVSAIHGGLRQGERNAVMQAFRSGNAKLLVSTSLTSRGIDVPTVANVVNYDIPEQVEEYVHRIGRTARMGRPGTAVMFVSEWDIEFFEAIRGHVGAENLEELSLSLYGGLRSNGS